MKIPFLPIVLDAFTNTSTSCVDEETQQMHHAAATPSTTTAVGLRTLFFLSHFHTDHLKGLTSSWGVGYHAHHRTIYCSRITRALLVNEFGAGIAPYVVALPLFQWVSLDVSSTYAVRCCLLPACHISGSVQFLFDTYLGRILYTGDVKVNPALIRLMKGVVDATGPVDHLFLDDTWLHLDKGSNSGLNLSDNQRTTNVTSSSVSRLLNDEQLDDAFAAVHKRVAHFAEAASHQTATVASTSSPVEGTTNAMVRQLQEDPQQCDVSVGATTMVHHHYSELERTLAQLRHRPYVLRIYLHNHFGKEVILQRLAKRLGTTILVDDARYKRLQAIASTLPATEVQRDLHLHLQRLRSLLLGGCGDDGNDDAAVLSQQTLPMADAGAPRHFLAAAMRDAKECWDAEAVDIERFVPYSRAVAHWSTSLLSAGTAEGLEGGSTFHHNGGGAQRKHQQGVDADDDVSGAIRDDGVLAYGNSIGGGCGAATSSLSVSTTLAAPIGCIEVVNSRALISPHALNAASQAPPPPLARRGDATTHHHDGGTPHYGIVMTGWAKLHRSELAQNDRLWQIPYTMHSTPEGLVELVGVLRPQSITPLHYDRQRGFLMLSRLGGFLRAPYVNSIISASTLKHAAVPLSLQRYVFGSLHSDEIHETRNECMSVGGARTQSTGLEEASYCQRRHGVRLRECRSDDDDDASGNDAPPTRLQKHPSAQAAAGADRQARSTPLRDVSSNAPPQMSLVTSICSLSQLADEYCAGQ